METGPGWQKRLGISGASTRRIPVVVLAGGRSRRFFSDKLAVRLNSRPCLSQVIERVRPIASDVFVSTSSAERQRELARLLSPGESFLLDRARIWGGGPAGAIGRALDELGDGPVLFVPGDMPWLEASALRRLIEFAEMGPTDIAAPLWPSGESENLVQWHESRRTLRHLPPPWGARGSGRRASEYLRAVPHTRLVPVAALSKRPGSFSHLTYASDLEHPALRGSVGSEVEPRLLQGAPKRFYHEGQAHRVLGQLSLASRAFHRESQWYAQAGLSLLARHALDDAIRTAGASAGGRRR